MISKKYLEELLQTTIENGFQFERDGLLDEELNSGVYPYNLGKYQGRQELLMELLKKFE